MNTRNSKPRLCVGRVVANLRADQTRPLDGSWLPADAVACSQAVHTPLQRAIAPLATYPFLCARNCFTSSISATHALYPITALMELYTGLGEAIDVLHDRILRLLAIIPPHCRILIALAGVPASGKSTIAASLLSQLNHTGISKVAVVPMVSLIRIKDR